MSAFLLGRLYGGLKVAEVIQAVENTNDINTVRNGLLNEILYYVVCIVVVPEDVLSTEQHLQFGILKSGTKLAESLPRIFLQETEAGVKCGTAPALYGMVADLVHLLHDGKHQLGRHSRGDQRLMGVTQYRFGNLYRLCCNICHNQYLFLRCFM